MTITTTTKKRSQEDIVLDHLMTRGSISGVEADAVYKIRWLPTRIKYLRDEGYDIKGEWKKDGTGQKYKRYSLDPRAPFKPQVKVNVYGCGA